MLLESTTTTCSFYIVYTGYPKWNRYSFAWRNGMICSKFGGRMLCILSRDRERVYALWKLYCKMKSALENAIENFWTTSSSYKRDHQISRHPIHIAYAFPVYMQFKPRIQFIQICMQSTFFVVNIFLMYSTNTNTHFFFHTLVN